VEVPKLKTVADLIESDDERVELIDGEIVQRPMARSEHALIQSGLSDEILPFKRRSNGGGWWIMTEISVRYGEHQCPTHDLAGWRKERVPDRPSGLMEVVPEWVCEITSPGHERKDLFHNFLLLQQHRVPFYWVVCPEEKTLIAYRLAAESYKVIFSVACKTPGDYQRVRIPPFEEVVMSLKNIISN
jgi:Uma2 family endonuclease